MDPILLTCFIIVLVFSLSFGILFMNRCRRDKRDDKKLTIDEALLRSVFMGIVAGIATLAVVSSKKMKLEMDSPY